RATAGDADRRPVQLVRAPVAAAVLGRARVFGRGFGVRHPVRGRDHADAADGAVHAVRDRLPVGRAAAPGGGRVGAPGVVALARHRADRSAAVGADVAGTAARGAGTFGPGRRLGADQAAAFACADRGGRVRHAAR